MTPINTSRLTEAREKAGLTSQELGKAIGITFSTFHIEAGKVPTLNIFVAICKQLNVSADWLLGIEK